MLIIAIAFSAAMLLVGAPELSPAAQRPTPTAVAGTCAGLDAYGDALLAVAAPFSLFTREIGLIDRDLMTLSAPEWIAFAEHTEDLQAALEAIDPPPGLAAWHQLQIERIGFLSAFARSAASIGAVVTGLAMSDQAKQSAADLVTETDHAIETCPGFADIYERWLGPGQAAATPASPPT